jgi:hypothetical protein
LKLQDFAVCSSDYTSGGRKIECLKQLLSVIASPDAVGAWQSPKKSKVKKQNDR